jgi:putative MATE family efflux protein
MSYNRYTEGSINKHYYDLTIPALYSLIANFSYIFVEMYFLSRIGKTQITAMSFAASIISIFQMVGLALGIAASSTLARYIGAKDIKNASAFTKSLIILLLVISVVIATIGIISIDQLFTLLGASSKTLPYIQQFMQIWYLSVFFVLLNYVISNILRVYGFPKVSSKIQILSSVLNLALAWILIIVFNMGMVGAALAGLITRLVGIMIAAILIFRLKLFLKTTLTWKQFIYFSKSTISITIPATLTNIIGPLSSVWIIHLLTLYGQNAVAGYGIASRIEQIFLIPLYAISASVGPIVGQNFGAKNHNRSYAALKKSYLYSIIFGSVSTICLLLGGWHIAYIFSHDPKIINIAMLYLRIVPISYIGWGVLMMTNANFNALGKPKISTTITTLRIIVCFIPLSLLLKHMFNITGIFLSFCIANILIAFIASNIAYRYYNSHKSQYI